jgi:hypothetical protein
MILLAVIVYTIVLLVYLDKRFEDVETRINNLYRLAEWNNSSFSKNYVGSKWDE